MQNQDSGNFFQSIKIQKQLLLLLLFSSIVPVSITGIYGIVSSSSALTSLGENQLLESAVSEGNSIESFLKGINEDVLFLSKTPQIQGIVRARGGIDKETNASAEDLTKQLETLLTSMMQSKSYYMQLRYLDEKGQEIVRVDSDGTTVKVIPKADLQNKGDRPYFTDTMKLPLGSLYTSPVNLNQERGQIERPFKPVIRYATPVYDGSGKARGIVIANVFANQFIKYIEEGNHNKDEAFLVNEKGYYISHPQDEKEWGEDLKKEEKLEKDYGEALAKEILSGDRGVTEKEGSYTIAYSKIPLDPQSKQFLVAINQSPKSEILKSVNAFKGVAIGIILGGLAIVLPIGIFRGKQLVNLIKQLVNGISSASQQIFSTLEEQERIASQQAASVNETTTTMDELEASSRQSAQQAKAAVTAAQEALVLAQGGTEAVGETLEGMFTLEKKVGAIAEQIVLLSEQASQIGTISQFVSDVANKTNMLALNSSVEAVRAGEHGKGFSVVANEIRKLADQSQRSAEKINNLVTEIQGSINSTVMVTEEGTKTVTAGVETAKKTDAAFSGVTEAVNKVVINNQQISLNLKQQVDAIQQVVQAMDSINQGAKETAVGINQTKVGTEQLNETAQQLNQMV
ncbi:MAG TPA: methyl-accepting chemotaxis protein [Cyanobacteria bacterium UBA11149]|nr:methyl-accepting chemotaxis protein [Cyanobacteria bacterium UBA11367]HBE58401.1 methyl-accepting chemotaxis protein [Cyanobacteria bacterium UBA11366]HBK62715.1 methyl-accepting chemotaxis protein [Cyanobacteria bacterium UBA11166]HBR75157.1 methyl-accepting chemotaxis protein [Cyanobacteria bacterium UBA11159]HBS69715.1 methyl-accepting chemotaxis protein [Cyanobacteria bacterium UBA11153]HBW87378.1 methyl-accepting chemotaxis protein [Cyanobacteria bacterium UBA11149]HCA93436.1 methyl-a